MGNADLHVHSTRSDGSTTRREILQQAKALGITCLSFTEHDTAKFVGEGVELGREYGIKVVPGVEISACDHSTGKLAHVLGYNFNATAHIEALCEPILAQRHKNSLQRIEILRGLGYKIDDEAVRSLASDSGYIYKQHILAHLWLTGQTDGVYGDVHRKYFTDGGPCDLKMPYASVLDAVCAIHADGGVAVLAHPGQQQNVYLVSLLVVAGLDGVEMAHPANSSAVRNRIKRLCERFNLIQTGGSDYHGRFGAVDVRLGACLAPADCPLD